MSKKCALLFALVFPTVATWLYFVQFADAPAWVQQASYIVGKVIQFVAIPAFLFWLSRSHSEAISSPIIEKESPSDEYRFQNKKKTSRLFEIFFFGIISGILIGSNIWLVAKFWLIPANELHSLKLLMQVKLKSFSLESQTKFIVLGLFYALFHSGLEEFYWRWLVDRKLRTMMSPASSILLSSLGFMAHHVVIMGTYLGWANPLAYVASLGVALGGAIWAYFDRTQKTIFGAWISHGLVDASLFYVGILLLK